MRLLCSRFLGDQSGATVAAVNGIGSTLNTNFTSVNSSLK